MFGIGFLRIWEVIFKQQLLDACKKDKGQCLFSLFKPPSFAGGSSVSLSPLSEGAHRCHSAVSSFIVSDLQSINVTAALLRSPCQIIPSPQRAAPVASSYTFPLSVKSNMTNSRFGNSRKSQTSPHRVRLEQTGSPPPSLAGVASEERCVSVGCVCKPLHPCHLFHSERERGDRGMLM